MTVELSLPVYVIHYRAPDWCRKTVESLRSSDVPVEIIITNNGGDLTGINARVIAAPANLGYAGAANIAIADEPSAPLIVLTNHDVEVAEDALRRLVEAARHPEAGVLGANVGNGGGVRGDRSMDITWLDWTSGTCMLLRRACLDEIGNLDARLHSYCEDVDLGQREQRRMEGRQGRRDCGNQARFVHGFVVRPAPDSSKLDASSFQTAGLAWPSGSCGGPGPLERQGR